MKSSVSISEAEWEIMKIVWASAPVAAAEVVEQMSRRKGWAPRTTRTLLERLTSKGALKAEPDGRRYLYRAAIKQGDCVRRESRTFLDRVFGGRPAAMLMHLVRETRLSKEEIAELRRLLKEKEAKDE